IYPHVPAMIRFFLGEEPVLRNVPTYSCGKPEDLAYVLDHLEELVVKEARGSGGYGMLVGPRSTSAQCADLAAQRKAQPADRAPPPLAPPPPAALRRGGHPPPPCRPQALRADGTRHPHRARRADPGRPGAGFAGGQFEPGGRHQGYLGAGRLDPMLSRTANSL